MTTLPVQVAENLQNIRFILLDVDGVLTDGRLGLLPNGQEIKFFSIYDGLAIRLVQKVGWQVGFLSGRDSPEVSTRARELGVEIVIQGSDDKIKDFEKILETVGLKAFEIAYIGDDLPDIPVLKRVGFSAAPSNAAEPVKNRVHYVTKRRGGHGAVREVVDFLLRTSGKERALLEDLDQQGAVAGQPKARP